MSRLREAIDAYGSDIDAEDLVQFIWSYLAKTNDVDRKFVILARSRRSGKEYTHADGMLFLARDSALPAALQAYVTECQAAGCEAPQVKSAELLRLRVIDYQTSHPTKLADVDSVEEARCLI
jgi:hypothetical protein